MLLAFVGLNDIVPERLAGAPLDDCDWSMIPLAGAVKFTFTCLSFSVIRLHMNVTFVPSVSTFTLPPVMKAFVFVVAPLESNVERIKKALLEKEIITQTKEGVFLADRVFETWFKRELL